MKLLRYTVWALADAAILASVVLWFTTGTHVLTRFPSETIAQAQGEPEEGGLDDLFADSGINDDHGELESVDNEFRLGLLPSGPGRDSLSVASVTGVGLAASAAAWWFTRKKKDAATPGEDAVA